MAHGSQLHFVRLLAEHLPNFFKGARVLEIGALDINGSTRKFFEDCDYTGVDVGHGPGVDVVCPGQSYDAVPFDCVISCNVMEHNPEWAKTIQNMIRLCRPGGLVIMTCAGRGFPEHGTTRTDEASSPFTVAWNYYRNLTENEIREACDMSGLDHRFWVNWRNYDTFFAGVKGHDKRWPISAVDDWIAAENATVVNRIRALMAWLFGEAFFTASRRIKRLAH